MASESPVIKALLQVKLGDEAFTARDYHRALSCFQEALAIANRVPASHEWRREGFVASCKAGLSGALGGLGRTQESLQAAEESLVFFEQYGHMYPAERSRWFQATFNKGAALAQLNRDDEALAVLRKARDMIGESPEGEQLRTMCNHNIKIVTEALATAKQLRPWWKFW